jgi:hypothetical protein
MQFFNDYISRLIEYQPQDKRGQLKTACENLMRDVERNLSMRSRDKFTQNLTNLKRDILGKS